ncbi:TetR/AcrR family transcriptional regulator [bacterium]|nr:TetR/AcrR family transcriptional regulator [bacterium]QQR59700.1 MAG: TetR/AcrR family transcriptional regulator [Candidatus Melainabacteria bacterium]
MPKTGLTSEQLKQKAIACTIERMRKFGYEKVRLSDIAKDLGVTHAALYSHFADKAALFDAVTEKWLLDVDEKLAAHCDPSKNPLECITNWCVELHKAKREKVQFDPELYRAFNFCAQIDKPFVQHHISTMRLQLKELVERALAQKLIRGDAQEIVEQILDATTSFHHPSLVVYFIEQDREPALRKLLQVLFRGLK